MLAFGAEVAAPVADGDALQGGAADGAGLPATVGDPEMEMGGAQSPIGAVVVDDAGPFLLYGLPQDLPGCPVKPLYIIRR